MRPYRAGSFCTARVVVDVLLVIAGFLIATQVALTAVLLANPLHPLREHFQVTTILRVPPAVWPSEGVVRVESGIAAGRAELWAYVTYVPASRWFVSAAAALAFSWWACAVLMLLHLRRAFTNVSAGTPFPRDNIRCIRVAGWSILGMAAVNLAIDAVMLGFMHATTTVAGKPPAVPLDMLQADFPFGTILAGLAVVILAEVFRAGADLQDEQALTV